MVYATTQTRERVIHVIVRDTMVNATVIQVIPLNSCFILLAIYLLVYKKYFNHFPVNLIDTFCHIYEMKARLQL